MSPHPPPAGAPPAGPATPRLRLRISPAAEAAVRDGHPWVFADKIRDQNRPGAPGDIAVIYDRNDRFLAAGLHDPDSPIRIRILQRNPPRIIDTAWYEHAIRAALDRRAALFSHQTTGYRCIHGENDGLPGLVLDRYGSTAVLKLYTSAWFPWLPTLVPILARVASPHRLILRLSRNVADTAARYQLADGMTLIPHPVAPSTADAGTEPGSSAAISGNLTEFLENGLRFEAEVVRGQKTGFFLDQRDNRSRVAAAAPGLDVLNAFSFSGGFSLYAARAGARSVTDLDISAHALESARRNFNLNQDVLQVRQCRHASIQADAFPWLAQAPGGSFDLVILDPPSLARRDSETAGALHSYRHLVTHGLRTLRPGGLLVAASCSAHVPADAFFRIVRDTATASRRPIREEGTTFHPPDHPATFREAHYLKCIYLRS